MSRIIIITGTRKGMGKALSEYYLAQGDFVYGCSRRVASIEHERYQHFRLDVADEAAVVAMVRAVYKQHKRIDILLNNAGIASMNHFLLTPYSTVEKVFQTNYNGTFLFCREVAKFMKNKRQGRIVNYSTVASALNLEGELVYASSKAAVEKLSNVLAKELGDFGITVNTVGPTPIQTDLIKNVPDEKIAELIAQQAIKRLGTFEDVLNVIEFFVSEKSAFITGQTVYLGGVN